jgi:hypothetical protein
MPEVSEVSLKAFFDSTWFKTIARGAMILGAIGVGYVGGVMTVINTKVTALENNITEVKGALATATRDAAQEQALRDRDIDAQRAAVNTDLDIIRQSLATVIVKVNTMGSDVSEIKGVLKQMNATRPTAWNIPSTMEN